MSMRSFVATNWTTGNGTADNSQVTSGQFMSLDPGSASQMIMIEEIEISGFAAASAVQNMQMRRSGTLGTGGASALASPNTDGPLNNFAAAITTVPLAAVAFVTNQPIPSNSAVLAKLNCAFNAFGGVYRWNVSNTNERWWMVGNAVNISSTLSNNTGSATASVSSKIAYELP